MYFLLNITLWSRCYYIILSIREWRLREVNTSKVTQLESSGTGLAGAQWLWKELYKLLKQLFNIKSPESRAQILTVCSRLCFLTTRTVKQQLTSLPGCPWVYRPAVPTICMALSSSAVMSNFPHMLYNLHKVKSRSMALASGRWLDELNDKMLCFVLDLEGCLSLQVAATSKVCLGWLPFGWNHSLHTTNRDVLSVWSLYVKSRWGRKLTCKWCWQWSHSGTHLFWFTPS